MNSENSPYSSNIQLHKGMISERSPTNLMYLVYKRFINVKSKLSDRRIF